MRCVCRWGEGAGSVIFWGTAKWAGGPLRDRDICRSKIKAVLGWKMNWVVDLPKNLVDLPFTIPHASAAYAIWGPLGLWLVVWIVYGSRQSDYLCCPTAAVHRSSLAVAIIHQPQSLLYSQAYHKHSVFEAGILLSNSPASLGLLIAQGGIVGASFFDPVFGTFQGNFKTTTNATFTPPNRQKARVSKLLNPSDINLNLISI